MVPPSVLPVMMYCGSYSPPRREEVRQTVVVAWTGTHRRSQSTRTRWQWSRKDKGAEVAAWGAGFDTVTGMVAAACSSSAGIVSYGPS